MSQRGVAVQGWGTPPNIVFFYNGVSNNGSYPIVVSINSWGVGEVARQFGERKLAWWGLEARRRRWLATDFARDIAVTKGIITRALRVLDTRLVLEIFCPTRTRLGPNTTRTE